MNKEEHKKYKTIAKSLKPFIIIGKNGISDNSIENISKNLKANKLTKIKLLKTHVDSLEENKQEVAERIAQATKSEIIDQVGQMIVLYKR